MATKVAAHSSKVNVEGRVRDSEGDHEMAFEKLALESTELDEEDLEENEELAVCDKDTVNKAEFIEFKKQLAAVQSRNKAIGLKVSAALKVARTNTEKIRKAAQLNDGAWTLSIGKKVKK